VSVWIRVLCGLGGLFLQLVVLDAAIRTFLLPRVATIRLSRYTSRLIAKAFRMIAGKKSYVTKDEILAIYHRLCFCPIKSSGCRSASSLWRHLYSVRGVDLLSRFCAVGSSIIGAGIVSAHQGQYGPSVHRGRHRLGLVSPPHCLHPHLVSILSAPRICGVATHRSRRYSRHSLGVLEIAASVDSYQRLDELWREWEAWFIDVGETHTTS